MANTCDYCHKPLSLMRRLRGEQFCTVEHLEAYAAQQAEFALERLAASVNDKPNTERPPLPRPAPRLRPIATPAVEAPPSDAEPVVATHEPVATAAAVAVQGPEPDYPMAPYLEQSAIAPRESEASGEHKAAFEPVEHWGKVAPGWSMPPFRSEPSDPRTWNAGKLVAQVPPVAGWRELLTPKPPAPEESAATVPLTVPLGKPVWAGMTDVVYGCFALAENHLEQADPLAAGLHAQASLYPCNQITEAQFSQSTPAKAEMPHWRVGSPVLPRAILQPGSTKPTTADRENRLESGFPVIPGVVDLALPHPDGWSWNQTMQATSTVHHGWQSAQAKKIKWNSVPEEDAAISARTPVGLALQGQTSAVLPWAQPSLWRNWSTLKIHAISFAVGPLTATSDVHWLPLLPAPVRVRSLRPVMRAGVRQLVKLAEPPAETPTVRTEIRQAGPVKYSPVAIIAMPPPQFAMAAAAMMGESRYAAQAPNGVWRLPRVRHTGYRALGPFPKSPLRVPDGYLRTVSPEMASASQALRIREVAARQDVSGVPNFAAPDAVRVHPADYLIWPRPKPMKLAKMLPERLVVADAPVPIKRFGPGRAGLQARRGNADGLARA